MKTLRLVVCAATAIGAVALWGLVADAHSQNPPAQGARPEPAIVSGVFVDSAGTPIPHGVLSVVGESLRVVTDSQGRFRLLVPPGPKLLAARSLGYGPLMWAVTLVSGHESVQRVNLSQLSITLAGITVTAQPYVPSRLAGFYHRRQLGLGKYLDREAIDRRVVMRAADLLQQIPGVRVVRDSYDPLRYLISFARCNLISGPAAAPAPETHKGWLPTGGSISPSVPQYISFARWNAMAGPVAPPAPETPKDWRPVGRSRRRAAWSVCTSTDSG